VLFAEVAALGGILLALGASVPISPYITTISFLIWVVCRYVGSRRTRRGWSRRAAAVDEAAEPGHAPAPAAAG